MRFTAPPLLRRGPLGASVALPLLVALAAPAPALANGQSTHVWITLRALELLPDGPVRDLLGRPELRDILMNGTMFPDWGYAPGGSRDHGEASHWEPFQQEYRAWIQEEFAAPYSEGEAAEHVAWLFGMASHGMADEHFDSLFMERSRIYDPGWADPDVASLDTASDVLFMATVGGIPQPERWLPVEAIEEVYARALPDDPLDVDGLQQGFTFLHVAVAAVEELRQNPERIETFSALYPWSQSHLNDPGMPGAPPDEAEAVVRYWLDLWERLQGAPGFSAPVLLAHPGAGSFEHARDASTPEARLHLAMARGVDATTLEGSVRVATADGAPVAVDLGLFYGHWSHALLARPHQDWEADTDYVVTVGPGLASYDGEVFDGSWSATFSTGSAPPPPPPAPPPSAEPAGCGASIAAAPPRGALATAALLALRRRRRGSR